MKRALLAVTVAWCAVMVHRGEPLAWDELEFFRATRWIAEGRLPFRDYWEHHLPLQWFAFAPVAWLFGGGAGAGAVVALRWAQVALWVGVFWRFRGFGVSGLAILLAAPAFVSSAVQYRVDVLGIAAFVAAIWTAATPVAALGATGRRAATGAAAVQRRWIAFGALMSLAVLANMRLAPTVIVAAALVLFWRDGEWRFNPRALSMLIGVAAVVALFLGYLFATRSWPGFVDGVIRYNSMSDALVPDEANTFWSRLAAPFVALDVAAIAFWLAAAAGLVAAARTIRTPRIEHLCALLALVTLLVTALTGVQYPYHFLITYVLLLPFVRVPEKWAYVIVAAALILNVSRMSFEPMAYQDRVMRMVDARTAPNEKVWDGVGYALRREPAYRYWFLPAGVRLMAQHGHIEPYDLPQFLANPPAAIVYNERIQYWLTVFRRLGEYVLRHYLPLERNLWIPGMSARVDANQRYAAWLVPRTGRYEVHASELLAKHPWFSDPLRYGSMRGSELAIPLARLPKAPVDVRIDGVVVAAAGVIELRRGSRLELRYRGAAPAGVVVVPADTGTICAAPDGAFGF